MFFSGDGFEHFKIQDVVFDKPEIDLGDIFLFKADRFMNEGISKYKISSITEIRIIYPIHGIRKLLTRKGYYFVMDFNEFVRKE